MIVLLCYEDDEHAPQPEGRKTIVGFQRITVVVMIGREPALSLLTQNGLLVEFRILWLEAMIGGFTESLHDVDPIYGREEHFNGVQS
jgi:hypothetical protein